MQALMQIQRATVVESICGATMHKGWGVHVGAALPYELLSYKTLSSNQNSSDLKPGHPADRLVLPQRTASQYVTEPRDHGQRFTGGLSAGMLALVSCRGWTEDAPP